MGMPRPTGVHWVESGPALRRVTGPEKVMIAKTYPRFAERTPVVDPTVMVRRVAPDPRPEPVVTTLRQSACAPAAMTR